MCEKNDLTIFIISLQKLLPLYLLVALGFIVGKTLGDHRASIAKILIYVMAPAVVFSGVLKADLGHHHLFVPVIIFILSSTLCLTFFKIGNHFFRDTTKNILAFGAGDANSGYFALPVGIAIFGVEHLPFFVLTAFGFIFYEYTVAFFVSARGHHSPREALMKVLKLPAVYAFSGGIFLNVLGVRFNPTFEELSIQFRGCYAVLGMMLIGLGVAAIKKVKFDWTYLSLALLAKFVCWPILLGGVLYLDKTIVHFLDPAIYGPLFFFSAIPMAANTVAVATELKIEPEKAAVAVLISTLLALITVPLTIALGIF